MTESVSDPKKRSAFQANFAVPSTFALSPLIPPALALHACGFTLGGGAVVLSGQTITIPATYISATTTVLYTSPVSAFVGALAPNGITQGFISTSGALTTLQNPQTSGVFPNGFLPLFEATCAGGQIRSLVDFRPSYI